MNLDTVLYVHNYLVEYFENADDPITPPGVKDLNLLESAISRPFQSAGGRDCYKNDFDKSAALFHSIINNHPFYNGNKRTALLSTVLILDSFMYWLDKCDDDEMYEFTRQVAAHEISDSRDNEILVISNWLQKNSRRKTREEQRLKFHDLRDILHRFGYEIENTSGYTLEIKKDGDVVETILKKGMQGFEDYDKQYIKELRKRLNLTDEYGIDSVRFYGQKGISESLNEFMLIRSDVVKRLAKI